MKMFLLFLSLASFAKPMTTKEVEEFKKEYASYTPKAAELLSEQLFQLMMDTDKKSRINKSRELRDLFVSLNRKGEFSCFRIDGLVSKGDGSNIPDLTSYGDIRVDGVSFPQLQIRGTAADGEYFYIFQVNKSRDDKDTYSVKMDNSLFQSRQAKEKKYKEDLLKHISSWMKLCAQRQEYLKSTQAHNERAIRIDPVMKKTPAENPNVNEGHSQKGSRVKGR